MRLKYNIFLFFVITFLSQVHLARASCDTAPPAKLNITFNYGKISYINDKSNSQFPQKPHASIMGLTVSDLKQSLSGESQIQSNPDNNFCVYLTQLNVDIGYPEIDVYIDKKYRPDSCNYKVIMEHEKYHVRVQQEGLKFFAPKIKEAYKIALKKIKPQQAYTQDDAKHVAEGMIKKIEKDVKPLMDYVQQRLLEKNAVIDTQESYANETKKCKRW